MNKPLKLFIFALASIIGLNLWHHLPAIAYDPPWLDRLLPEKTRVPHNPPKVEKPVPAIAPKRLHLHSVHTGETINIVFWRDGAYIPEALDKLNHFLRDHRSGAVTQMDPELFSIIHRLYGAVDGEGPIEIISGYRSAETNAMLRRMGRNVARKSMHVIGRAMDIRIQNVSAKKVRDTALDFKIGGVGFYPKSNFVHIDTGRYRFW